MAKEKKIGAVWPWLVVAAVFVFVGWIMYRTKNEQVPGEPTRPQVVTEKTGLIRIDSPKPYETLTSPVNIRGAASGKWYFEASFVIRLVDADGKIIVQELAQAKGDWMTTELVPFETVMRFKNPGTKTGELIFVKENPSGDPATEDTLRIPVTFNPAN